MTFSIRPLHLATDLHDIHRLTQQLGYPSPIEKIELRWQRIHQDPTYQTLVIALDDKIVGYAGLIQQYTWEFDDGYFRIQAFVIDEAYRGQGLGKQLIYAIQDLAKMRGLKRILVNSGNRVERYPAHAFYKNLGFDAYSIGFTQYLD